MPNFFIYAKDKTENQVEKSNDSTMNRIAAKIPTSRISYCKTIGKFDYRMLMNLNSDFSLSQENEIIKAYDYWQNHQYLFNTISDKVKQEDLEMYKYIRQDIINKTNKSLEYIVNTLVAILYTTRPNSTKKMLWSCFGEEIVENLKKNTKHLGKICENCGKRFIPASNSQKYCSKNCGIKQNLLKQQGRNYWNN